MRKTAGGTGAFPGLIPPRRIQMGTLSGNGDEADLAARVVNCWDDLVAPDTNTGPRLRMVDL